MRYAVACAALLAALFVSIFVGAAGLAPGEVVAGLAGTASDTTTTIVRELRLPRAALAALVGAGLGASGAALQGYTTNSLAAPGILGFSAMAALGAVAALYFGLSTLVPFAALLSTAIGAALVLGLVGRRQGATTLILVGVGIGALATAATGLLMNFAPNPWALSEMIYWLLGSLRYADPGAVWTCGPLTLIGLAILTGMGPSLRGLALGEETALSLGLDLRRVQVWLVIGVALCIGAGVAVAGAIGFVGLFVPHIIRLAGVRDPADLIPISALGGASFLILADIATRALSGPGTGLYLGVLTSLFGVPVFLWLAVRKT